MMRKRNVEPNVEKSSGPSGDPNSQYSTSNSIAHDLKLPYQHVPQKDAMLSGFVSNTASMNGWELGDDKAARTTSFSHAAHSMNVSVWGERSQTEAEFEEDPAIASAVALARAKRQATGFKSNSDPYTPPPAYEQAQPPILLVQQTIGTKDPLMRENGWRGPAYMSTTSKQAYVHHPIADANCMDGKEVDVNGRKVPSHGAFNNQINTVQMGSQPRFSPISETHDQFRNKQVPLGDDALLPRSGANATKPENVPLPISPSGVKPIGLAVVDRIRAFLFECCGREGVRAFTRMLRRMGQGTPAQMKPEEMMDAMQVFGLELSPQEEDELKRVFDRDRNGVFLVQAVIAGIRGRLSQARVKLIRQAYKQISPNDAPVTMQEMVNLYDPSQDPEVLRRCATPDQVLRQFVGEWDKEAEDTVTFTEFQDYYEDISGGIDNDEYFELLLRNAWHVTGGLGCVACTTNRKVLVTFTDGNRAVHTLKNDLRISLDDFEAMHKNLEEQGLSGIASIALVGETGMEELGLLQTAVLENRAMHTMQQAKGGFAPFKNSAISSYNLIAGDSSGNAIKDLYPERLSPACEKRMAREDPVEYSVYRSQNPMETTSMATYALHKNRYNTSLDEVRRNNGAAIQAAEETPDITTRYRVLSGHPHKEVVNGGYATNTKANVMSDSEYCQNPRKLDPKEAAVAHVARRLDYEPDNKMTIYRSDFRDQWKVPLDTTHMIELRQQQTGYSIDNTRHVLPMGGDTEYGQGRTLRKASHPILEIMRGKLRERGAGGFQKLSRILRAMDHGNDGQLGHGDFGSALRASGITLGAPEIEQLLRMVDNSDSEKVSINDFLALLRGPISERRGRLIRLAYNSLDRERSNAVSVRDMFTMYDYMQHPDVLRKRKQPEQVLQEFKAAWDLDEKDKVTFTDFQQYYYDISPAIDSDEHFEAMMRNCWHIT